MWKQRRINSSGGGGGGGRREKEKVRRMRKLGFCQERETKGKSYMHLRFLSTSSSFFFSFPFLVLPS